MHNNFFEITFHTVTIHFFLIVLLFRYLCIFEVFETHFFWIIFHFNIFMLRKTLFSKTNVRNVLSAVRNAVARE